MEREAAKRLLDAAQAARRIQQFTEALDFEHFSASELIRSAVERQFEIIGEALGKAVALSPDLSSLVPDLPKITGLRNRLIHGYDSVDDEIIWDIVQSKISPLLAQLNATLKSTDFPPVL